MTSSENSKASKKRPLDSENNTPVQSKRVKCGEKISEVEEIVKKLKKKHETKYSIEKLNIWAHLLHIEKHDSYDVPPDVPYFKGRSSNASTSLHVSQMDTTNPPRNRVSLRTECIDQLSKWHDLLEKQVITQEDYDKVQQTILKDIMQNN